VTVKRIFDLTIGLIALLASVPLLLLIAVAIKIDSPGPVFFRQWRVGLRGCRFRIYKFRTMSHEERVDHAAITIGEDPRITRVGRVLRRYKLDELAQLINVVRGDMSLVGPRPELPFYVDQYPSRDRDVVLSVKPGITDLASMRYRDESKLLAREVDPRKAYVEKILPHKLAIARHYVRRQSLLLDVAILLKTMCVVLVGRDAAAGGASTARARHTGADRVPLLRRQAEEHRVEASRR
jgi:lipopolysaccharide/colanic/teichoic acid biosynthesis glycosyltransferase